MLTRFIRAVFRLLPYQRIPKLPRGMLSTHYDDLTADERRVLARYGARDPRGVAWLMKRTGAKTVEELALKHQQPDNQWRRRLNMLLARAAHRTTYHPHQRELMEAFRREKLPHAPEIKRRIRAITEGQ